MAVIETVTNRSPIFIDSSSASRGLFFRRF
jgi:hypothetical protein